MTSGERSTPEDDLRASSAPDNGSPLDPSSWGKLSALNYHNFKSLLMQFRVGEDNFKMYVRYDARIH